MLYASTWTLFLRIRNITSKPTFYLLYTPNFPIFCDMGFVVVILLIPFFFKTGEVAGGCHGWQPNTDIHGYEERM